MSDGSVVVEQRKAGTWTLTVQRGGTTIHQRSGIPDETEARLRAKVWRELCGYKIRVERLQEDR